MKIHPSHAPDAGRTKVSVGASRTGVSAVSKNLAGKNKPTADDTRTDHRELLRVYDHHESRTPSRQAAAIEPHRAEDGERGVLPSGRPRKGLRSSAETQG